MTPGSGIVIFANSLLSCASFLIPLGGLVICVSNQRSSPKMWLMSLGFAGLVMGGLWNRLGLPFLANSWGGKPLLSELVLLGGLIHLIAWSLLVWGLRGIVSDL